MDPMHTRLLCPSLSPGVCSNSCSLSWWCYPTISSSVAPFSFCPQPFPASGFFPMKHQFLHIRWPQYWSFSFNISPSNEYSGLTAFRSDWFDLLAVQETLHSLLQHHSLASIPWPSAFFTIPFSQPCMTTEKTIALIHRPLLAKWCLGFLICCLGLS